MFLYAVEHSGDCCLNQKQGFEFGVISDFRFAADGTAHSFLAASNDVLDITATLRRQARHHVVQD